MVPAPPLAAVPWGALPALAGRPVRVVPSARAWLDRPAGAAEPAHRASGPRASAVLVAGPGLPGAEAEVRRLTALRPEATVLTGDDAAGSEVGAALGRAGLAHLACHGTRRRDAPLFSALQLADGSFTAYDLERVTTLPEVVRAGRLRRRPGRQRPTRRTPATRWGCRRCCWRAASGPWWRPPSRCRTWTPPTSWWASTAACWRATPWPPPWRRPGRGPTAVRGRAGGVPRLHLLRLTMADHGATTMRPRLRARAAALAVVVLMATLVGCGGDDGDGSGDGSGGAGDGLAASMHASLQQSTLFTTSTRSALSVSFDGNRELRLATIQLDTQLFERVEAPAHGARVRGEGRVVVMPLRYGDAVCDVSPDEAGAARHS